ncbi:hypothetical protein N7470_003932 [Penicillium chermesinum]|nr:hypothetical protein N7470_003932 [Penicillium chermesinum]
MSGLDVEALLESTATPAAVPAASPQQDSGDGHSNVSYDRRDRDRDPSRDRRRRRPVDADDHDDIRSPHSGSANGSHRSRTPDNDRRYSRRDRYGDRRSNGDYYRGGGRHRSRSPRNDRRYRPRVERDHSRDHSRDRGHDRGHDRGRRDRRRTPTNSPEPNDDERDKRTVFVQQLTVRLRTRDLIEFFTQAGPVKEAQIVKDRVSGRSKGVGYVEFRDEESVARALELTGQKLTGQPIIVSLTEAEKNRQARNREGRSGGQTTASFHRLYVGNVHFSITEKDLYSVFVPFGELEYVQLQTDEDGRSKGYGFIQFVNPSDARTALEGMNNFELAGRTIRVGLGNDKSSTPDGNANRSSSSANQQGSSFSGQGGRGIQAGGSNNFARAGGNEQGAGASALDDADVAGVNFNNYSRDSLMRALARTGPSLPTPATPASRCIKISNAFDASEVESDEWIKELENEVRAECEQSYGRVIHISLDPHSDGDIYLKFERVAGGEKALQGLNGRFFGGRTITAEPVVDAVYRSLFNRNRAI